MPNLFPKGYQEERVESSQRTRQPNVGYQPGLAYDGEDLVRDGNHVIQACSGVQAWSLWCQKCLSTERYCCSAYSTDYGIETQEAMKAETREKAESILTREINEALLADPYKRTKYISEILFHWNGADSVEAEVTAVGIDGTTIDFSVTLGGGTYGV